MVLVVCLTLLALAPTAMASETGGISGAVTGVSPKTGIVGIGVCADAANGPTEECVTSGASGEYTISGLPAGEYYVEFFTPSKSGLDYVGQYFEGATSFENATKVTVAAGVTTPGIDAELEKGAEISGVVTSAAAGKAAIKGIAVCAFPKEGSTGSFGCAETDASGDYTIMGLSSGEYDVEFFLGPESEGNYAPQYYDKKALPSEASPVLVTAPNLQSGINAELEEGGSISGKVTDALTGGPLGGILVCAAPASRTSFGGCEVTNPNGEYTILGLASGKYVVEFFGGGEYLTQFYDGKSSPAEAEEVTVVAPATTSGIDAALQRHSQLPNNTTLPTVSGAPAVGGTLLCANGLWTGIPTPTFSQQWLRDGAPIAGAVGASYVVGEADAGHSVACQVTATNTRGQRSATSAAVAIPAPPPPPPPAPEVLITGSKLSVSGKATKVRLTCTKATCMGSVDLTLRVVVKRRRGKKTVSRRETLVLANGSYSIVAGASANVTLRLTAIGQKRLAHAKHHPVSAEVTVKVEGGSTANTSVRVS